MLLFKRFFLGSLALSFIFFGGSGTQSSSVIGQATGIVGILVGLVVLYVFLKMAWRAMGCLPSFIIFSVVALFLLYALGVFNSGIENIGENISKLVGSKDNSAVARSILVSDEKVVFENIKPKNSPSKPDEEYIFDEEVVNVFEEDFDSANIAPQANKSTTKQENDTIGKIINIFADDKQEPEQAPTMEDAPTIYGSVRVVNADTLLIQGKYLKIFGIDAPEANQTCANKQGRSYPCGKEAALWLKNWVSSYEVECRIMKQDSKGNMVGTCVLGDYDIGAALINAGWVVVTTQAYDIYGPYEQQAQENRRGLWQGNFYRPADWRKIQAKKPKIKITKPKQKSIFSGF